MYSVVGIQIIFTYSRIPSTYRIVSYSDLIEIISLSFVDSTILGITRPKNWYLDKNKL